MTARSDPSPSAEGEGERSGGEGSGAERSGGKYILAYNRSLGRNAKIHFCVLPSFAITNPAMRYFPPFSGSGFPGCFLTDAIGI
jgi:hypothetical protein